MRVVRYASNAPWVGSVHCPSCGLQTAFWKSSGMSESFPHFYCDTCSNAIHRQRDKELVYPANPSELLLNTIAETLPLCPCGGRFKPGADPKCPYCGAEFTHQASPVERLTDPHVILLDGACLIRDELFSYQISIGSLVKYWYRVARSALTFRCNG